MSGIDAFEQRRASQVSRQRDGTTANMHVRSTVAADEYAARLKTPLRLMEIGGQYALDLLVEK